MDEIHNAPEVAPEVVPDEYVEYGGGALLAIEDDHSSSGSSSTDEDDEESCERCNNVKTGDHETLCEACLHDYDDGEDDDDAPPARSVVSKNANDRAKGIKVAAKGVRMNQEIADRIRERAEGGESILAIAEDIGFHPCAVRRVVRLETWVRKETAVGADGRVRIVAVAPTAEETAERKAKKTAPKAKKEKAEGSGEKRTREFYKTRIAELEAKVKEMEAKLAYQQKIAEQATQRAEMAENARLAIIEMREDAEAQAVYDGE
jgi:hypothetical protein